MRVQEAGNSRDTSFQGVVAQYFLNKLYNKRFAFIFNLFWTDILQNETKNLEK